MSQGETLSVNDLADREVAELEVLQKELTKMQMQQKNLSQQLKHVQGMLTTCEKNVATLGSKFSRKIQVVKMLKKSPDYVKSAPKSPYKN